MRVSRSLAGSTAIVLGLVLLSATPAAAAPAPDPKEEVRLATVAYNLGRYLDAAEHYEAAYELTQDYVLLFNIGQSYRLAGHSAHALTAYKSYLRAAPTSAPNREQVQRRVAELEVAVADSRTGKTAPPGNTSAGVEGAPTGQPAVAAVSRPMSPAPAPQQPSGWWWGRRWFWITAGSAAAFATGATIAGLGMKARFDELNGACGSRSATRPGCAESDISALGTRATIANTFWALAGVSAAAAGVLWFVEGPRVSVQPSVGGSTVGIVGLGRF